MDELMPVLRDRRLFYVDSRTTRLPFAYDTAQDFGVRSAFRNVPIPRRHNRGGLGPQTTRNSSARRPREGRGRGDRPSSPGGHSRLARSFASSESARGPPGARLRNSPTNSSSYFVRAQRALLGKEK